MGTLAFLGGSSLLFALILTPFIRDVFLRFGLVDRPDNRRKLHRGSVPRVGGIAILLAYVASFGVALMLPFPGDGMIAAAFPQVRGVFAAVLIVFATGLIDDLRTLSPKQKLIGELLAAITAWCFGVQVHLLHGTPLDPWISFVVTVVWLLACTNAFNLIDGLDGLASGVGLFATVTILIAAITDHNVGLAIVMVPLLGCLLGFLRYNFNPASVFLGDCGSLSIGFLLGCAGAIWSQKSTTLLGMTAPLMALSIPLIDTAISVLRRFLRHKPIFGADRGHIHHRLLARGISPRSTALLLYAVCGVAAAFSILQHAFSNRVGGVLIALFCAVLLAGIQFLGYVEFGITRRLLARGCFLQIIDDEVHLEQLEQSLATSKSPAEYWQALCGACKELGFSRVRLSLSGVVREEVFTEGEDTYQLRIPLAGGDYVNVHRVLSAESRPMRFAGLATVLQQTIPLAAARNAIEALPSFPPFIAVGARSFDTVARTVSGPLEESWNSTAQISDRMQ